MAAKPVEWVLVIYYGPAAHQAIYGRHVRKGGYTKDYIQLSRKKVFLDTVSAMFNVAPTAKTSVPLTYRWPAGKAEGAFVFQSADRPHLKWATSEGAPQVWKMTPSPNDKTPETIPGDPSHVDFENAENEFAQIAKRGAGQPYLLAIKLRDEPRTLHLRTYLKDPVQEFQWADISLVPQEIQDLCGNVSQGSALAWSLIPGGGVMPSPAVNDALSQLVSSSGGASAISALDADTGRALAAYLRNPGSGLFFDPTRNHDGWLRPAPLSEPAMLSVDVLLQSLEMRFPPVPSGDAIAEQIEVDAEEVEEYRAKIHDSNYSVPDSTATVKVRGAAQRAFSAEVKSNYDYRCAITGIATKEFLVASHIVPWSQDQDIRLDPSNGICLSLLLDRAFENGYLQIQDDLSVQIDWTKVGEDKVLREQLLPFDGKKLNLPKQGPPRKEYLKRRRLLVMAVD